jgi:hypothetical protein
MITSNLSTVRSEKLKKSFTFWLTVVEPEGSLTCSQQLAHGPYSEPDASSPHLIYVWHFIYVDIHTLCSTSSRFNTMHP